MNRVELCDALAASMGWVKDDIVWKRPEDSTVEGTWLVAETEADELPKDWHKYGPGWPFRPEQHVKALNVVIEHYEKAFGLKKQATKFSGDTATYYLWMKGKSVHNSCPKHHLNWFMAGALWCLYRDTVNAGPRQEMGPQE